MNKPPVSPPSATHLVWPAAVLIGLLAGLLLVAPSAQAACAEGLQPLSAPPPAAPDVTPRSSLLSLVRAAEQRSKLVGAARLLTDAAQADAEEARAGGLPQAALSTTAGPVGSQVEGDPLRTRSQLRPALTVSAPLYDAGRVDALGRWRDSLAEAAHQGQLSAQEQVALQAVTLALDRDRYRLHQQVWNQYAQKVCGLVDALEQIVAVDKGRRSELVQARKTLQQVLLSRAQSMTQLRQTEVKLRRLVGDTLPEIGPLSALLLDVPGLDELDRLAANSPAIVQMDAQAQAATHLADATLAGQKTQATWQLAVSRNLMGDHTAAWSAGVTVSIPLFNPGFAPAAQSAQLKAEAARLQREDTLESLVARLAEVHEQARAAMTRAHDVVDTLQSSEQVREATLQQWQQMGRRSLFDVVSAEGDHYSLRIAYVDALHDGQQAVALLWSLAGGVTQPLR